MFEHSELASDAAAGSAGETGLHPVESVEALLERFSLVYELPFTVFDAKESRLVPMRAMGNLCTSRTIVRQWSESPQVRIVRACEVGFDPTGREHGIRCNLWGGWPTTPKAGDCDQLLELLYQLCSGEANPAEVYDWVLKWLAYPVQHPGAKMRTALVFHGPQGTGKNMFFEAVMAIYGEYGGIIDQAAIEDKFNDWASRKLFLIADEVVARMNRMHTKNKLKGLITGEWVRVNPKNMPAYEERNHVNLVFLSNEVVPVLLERDDRRYFVVWTPTKLDQAFYDSVRAEIHAGGVAALHHHLMNLPLGDFKPWANPPMTQAKAELVDNSLSSSDRFWKNWLSGALPLPVAPVRAEDLYEVYRYWCVKQGIGSPTHQSLFLGHCARQSGARRQRVRHQQRQQSTVIYPPGAPLDLESSELLEHLSGFSQAVLAWKGRGTVDGDSSA
jgi:putative DNA primase/helicase